MVILGKWSGRFDARIRAPRFDDMATMPCSPGLDPGSEQRAASSRVNAGILWMGWFPIQRGWFSSPCIKKDNERGLGQA